MRRHLLGILYSSCVVVISGCSSCTAQHDPSSDRAKFAQESTNANQQKVTLTEDYTLPKPKPAGVTEVVDVGAAKYGSLCASCHGAAGAGDGAGAAGLNPKPRNLADATWQGSVTDEHIVKVIKEGGSAVGLSATMPPWGAVLKDEEIAEVVKTIRAFKK